MVKTILVDDHTIFCDGLERLLIETAQFEVIQKFNSGKNLLAHVNDTLADLLIIDIEMPEVNGFETIKRIRLNNSVLKIVILSMHEEITYSNEAQAIGANAYLVKSLNSDTIVESLINVSQGEKIFLNKLMQSEVETLISDRELQVLRLLSKGKTSNQISTELFISPLTVKAHRRNMIKKLNVSNSTELIIRAFEKGIL